MKQFLFNILVVLFDRLSMLIFQIWMSSYFVQTLGIEGFGNWSLIFNVIAILGSLCILSIDIVVIRDVVNNKDQYYQYLNAALAIQLIGAFILFSIGLLLYGSQNGVIFYSFISIIVGNFCIVLSKYPTWHYSALVESKYRSLSIVVSLTLTVILLYIILPLIETIDYIVFIYAAYYIIQMFVINIIYIFLFKGRYRFDFKLLNAKEYTKVGFTLVISTVSVMLFTQSDIIMIKYFLSSTDVGEFAAATKLTTSIFMVAGIIANTFYPKMIVLAEKKMLLFIRSLITLILFCSIIGSIMISISANWLVAVIYYPSVEISTVLSLHIWCSIFIFTGAFTSRYLYAKSLYKIEVLKTVYAALLNIVLNILLIPIFGIKGAVYSSLLAYFIANFMAFLFFSETKELFYIQMKSYINVFQPVKVIKEIVGFKCYFRS